MLTRIRGGTLYDPANGVDGVVADLHIRDGRIVAPVPDAAPVQEIDASGTIVMAGAIDLHTHIGGGKVNIARTMLIEDHRAHPLASVNGLRGGSGLASPSTTATGYRYAEMGYTACFEPAVLPSNARQAHLEMADVPMVDTGGYVLIGNDDFLLRALADGADQALVNDYVAWLLNATQCIGIKIVNPGGINAFKFNGRKLDVDEAGPHYGVTPRTIVRVVARALEELGVPHPLHIHASNLGVPGNFKSTLQTMEAAEGLPIHLTHVQFHSYGAEGERKFSSSAALIAEAVNRLPHVSVDVGQIMFGQTITCSADTMRQYANHGHAKPNKWTCMDIECEAGCGVVPFRYRSQRFVNALQWAIGLELFLLVNDPWRVILTTDHPNGAPFTTYPHLIRLLMDKGFRREKLAGIDPVAAAASVLGGLEREYSLYEIAVMTRAAPARLLGLRDRGQLGVGAMADVVVYQPDADVERMFSRPALVLKQGEIIVRDGQIAREPRAVTHTVKPAYDSAIERRLEKYFADYSTVRLANFKIGDDEMAEGIGSAVLVHPCGRGH
ncbi:MAG: formylmethanofuran dehydrogenase subunit A [Gammaproteobacteria bacterium]